MSSEREVLSVALTGDPDGAVRWKPDAWRRWVPVDCVPPYLVAGCLIRKQDLYQLASQVVEGGDDQAVAALIIAVQAWGSGVAGQGGDGRGPSRASAALGLPRLSPDEMLSPARLDAVRHAVALSRTDVAAAWRTLKRGPGHLPRWDEPFFTKLMHAAGYGHSPRPWPLVRLFAIRGRQLPLKREEPLTPRKPGDVHRELWPFSARIDPLGVTRAAPGCRRPGATT